MTPQTVSQFLIWVSAQINMNWAKNVAATEISTMRSRFPEDMVQLALVS